MRLLNVDLKDEKVWIQSDWIDMVVADQLETLGVDKKDIVLGFHPLYRRVEVEKTYLVISE